MVIYIAKDATGLDKIIVPFTVAVANLKINQASATSEAISYLATVRYLDYNTSSGLYHCRFRVLLLCRGLVTFQDGRHNYEWN
jgi:hypothetical protein